MKNDWEKIWQNRKADGNELQSNDENRVLLELKRLNGFDLVKDGISEEAYKSLCNDIIDMLSSNDNHNRITSIYEVGCGSGANLFLMEKNGLITGGIDYSEALIGVARRVLKSNDIESGEAIAVPALPLYDSVFAVDVFSYFEDRVYAVKVMEKMLLKSRYSIGIVSVHDKEKEDEMMEFRRKSIPEYDKRYKNLPKLCYSKDFFRDFAQKYNLNIVFKDSNIGGYWNNKYLFDCYMYKE